jgi:hypothetical protein
MPSVEHQSAKSLAFFSQFSGDVDIKRLPETGGCVLQVVEQTPLPVPLSPGCHWPRSASCRAYDLAKESKALTVSFMQDGRSFPALTRSRMASIVLPKSWQSLSGATDRAVTESAKNIINAPTRLALVRILLFCFYVVELWLFDFLLTLSATLSISMTKAYVNRRPELDPFRH